MSTIDWSNLDKTKIEDLPHTLQKFYCSGNSITKIENLPHTLKQFYCGGNGVTKIENLPHTLTQFYCGGNGVTKIENLPHTLKQFYCIGNSITKIENLPDSLQVFYYWGNPIQFVDNVTIERYKKFFGYFGVSDYTKIKKCQRVVIKWYWRRKRSARVVCNAVHDWIWKPLCRDGSYGVRLLWTPKNLGCIRVLLDS
jgi:Leucine-rich repeat (LRR) protein